MTAPATAWFPFYVGDYLGDTQRLTTEQHGAYLLLLLDYWRAGPPPDDDAVLRQITKLEAKAWKQHRPALSRMFVINDGVWRHKRVDKELAAAATNAERRSSKAQKAAQARWGDAPSNAPSMPDAMLDECPPQSPSPKKKSSEAGASGADAPQPPPDKVMFDAGKRLLTEAGVKPEKAGQMLGKWRRDHGVEAVIAALGRAQREGAIDPISFITGCLENRNGQRSHHDRSSDEPHNAMVRAAAADLRRRGAGGQEPLV